MRNAIQGHSDGTAAADYGEMGIQALLRAIEAFPRIDLAVPPSEIRTRRLSPPPAMSGPASAPETPPEGALGAN